MQTPSKNKAELATQLETFAADTGAVIIRSWSKIGSINGDYGTVLTITVQEMINAASGSKVHGIKISVKGRERTSQEANAYIDYDEIDALIKGIEYIAKIDTSVSKLDTFEADYKTEGDFTVCTFTSNDGSIKAAVTVGRIYTENVFLSQETLGQLKEFILTAKNYLDEIKQ